MGFQIRKLAVYDIQILRLFTLRMVQANSGDDLQKLEDLRGRDISLFHNGSIFDSLRASFVNLCGILDDNANSRLVS